MATTTERLTRQEAGGGLSLADPAEIRQFVETLRRFERGEITAEDWRAYRLVRGVYGQRQDEVQMVRVKVPQGVLEARQLHALADVADGWSRGFAHVTTRENVQFHFVRPQDLEAVLGRLAEAGLTTREACGNSVRNITACPYAGVAADEVFDVTPFARAMTLYLLRHRLSASLPRKFKIAFEGCAGHDHALTPINDLGFRARLRGENGSSVPGFRLTAGGGTSTVCTAGGELFDFLPAGEILNVAEAVLRVFHRLGDYKHKQRNRMKFLIKEMGFEAWRAEVLRTLAAVRAEGGAPLPFDPQDAPAEAAPSGAATGPPSVAEVRERAEATPVRGPGLTPAVRPLLQLAPGPEHARWVATNVRPQRQAGYSVVTVTVSLGDLTSSQLRLLADLTCAYGDGTLRTTPRQNVVLRWVPSGSLFELFRRLAAGGLGRPDANTVADVVSCPGAESCKLAVTQSRGLGRLLTDALAARPELVDATPGLQINISGCPNGCGQHHVAGIGLQGSARRLGASLAPQYFVMLGGSASGVARFGRLAAKVPARRVAAALERLIALYREERQGEETAEDFFARVELPRVKALLADLETLRTEDAEPADLVDLGDDTPMRLVTGPGECSA